MIAKTAKKNLFAIVAAFSKGTGLSVGTISGRYYGNQAFLDDFRAGRVKSITVRKLDDMMQGMSNDWPDGTPWPYLVPLLMDRPPKRRRARVKSGDSVA